MLRVAVILLLHLVLLVLLAGLVWSGTGSDRGFDPQSFGKDLLRAPMATLVAPVFWLALALGRLGLGYTSLWMVLPVGVYVWKLLGLRARAPARTRQPTRSSLGLTATILGYCALGWIYFFWIPVPTPTFTEFDVEPTERQAYLLGWERGYHWGMTDVWIIENTRYPTGYGEGLFSGFGLGVSEFESLLPGVTRSRQWAAVTAWRESAGRGGTGTIPLAEEERITE